MKRPSPSRAAAAATAAYLLLRPDAAASFAYRGYPGARFGGPPALALSMSSGRGFGSDADPDADPAPAPATRAPASPVAGQFELQELKFQLAGIRKAGASDRAIPEAKRSELAGYVERIVQRVPSPVRLRDLADPGRLAGRWVLALSTDPAALEGLPATATVVIDVHAEGQTLDYVLEFSERVFGLSRIAAKSTYFVDSSVVNPGMVTYVYGEVSAGMFGVEVPTGLFGMLKGRETYVDTVWFDGDYWIARGYAQDGTEYASVYVLDRGDEEPETGDRLDLGGSAY